MAESQHWRRPVAVLADPARRLLYARLVVASAGDEPVRPDDLDTADKRRLRALSECGLVVLDEGVILAADPFTALLADGEVKVRSGPERFLTGGRLTVLPRRASDRELLFEWLASEALAGEEVLDEKEFTARLAGLADDPVALRRHLVDFGAVVRSPDGSNYRLAADEQAG